ncbi:MAG: two-component system response regulator [Nitrospinae bacterium CG11_big_fil_rev_8_21_14_0_20_45_15]|nr:MAG: two-component system response regulator [Nitrospinae bacterium CG11_big_fil_rev_8_21_14_0_20_45_15]
MDQKDERITILIVDDVPENLETLTGMLSRDYKVKVALNGKRAIQIAQSQPHPSLILLDVMMPEMDGYEVCRQLKNNALTRKIPIIFVTALGDTEDEAKGFDAGGVDYIVKPVSLAIVRARVKTHLALHDQNLALEDLVRERTAELNLTQDVTIFGLATLAEYRDNETGGHIIRTKNYVRVLAEHLKSHSKFRQHLDDETIELLHKSAPLHDIGKVGVRDSILLKPGKLTPEEFEEMKKHTTFGRDAILKAEETMGVSPKTSFLRFCREIAYSHQEKWDGSGYPEGLKGEDIPISARLMAVADVYDALISKRCYKPSFTHKKAVEILTEGKGSHFDPEIIEAFLKCENTFREIAIENADYGEEIQNLKEN